MKKIRLDTLLVKRGLIESRERAKRIILSGSVRVEEKIISKPGREFKEDCSLELKTKDYPYVSRGGLKLEKALEEFGIGLEEKIAIDLGSSTGGFTDCLLQKGIRLVYAVDVGYGLLHWKLRNDPRVIVRERENARYLIPFSFPEEIDLIVIDLSFISLRLILPVIKSLLQKEGEIIALIKPQFEVGKGEVEKGGVIRKREKQREVIEGIKKFSLGLDFQVKDIIESPLWGRKGNREFFIYLKKNF